MVSSVFIATPMYGGACYGGYLLGMLDTLDKCRELGIRLYYSELMNESLITRGRNKLARLFLASPAEYLVFIDADIVFNGDDVLRLLKADKDIVCGLYPKKTISWGAAREAALRGEADISQFAGEYVANPRGYDWSSTGAGLVEIEHGGTGFMCIHRRVFEALSDKVPEYREATLRENGDYLKNADGTDAFPLTKDFFALSINEEGLYLSEDYHFCELWRSHGGKIHADLSINLRHAGTHVFSGDIRNGFHPEMR